MIGKGHRKNELQPEAPRTPRDKAGCQRARTTEKKG
jgi:hypothetical protein